LHHLRLSSVARYDNDSQPMHMHVLQHYIRPIHVVHYYILVTLKLFVHVNSEKLITN